MTRMSPVGRTVLEGLGAAAFPLSETLGEAWSEAGDPTGVDNVLPSTERWKPQRDASDNVTVNFKGPSDLDVSTVRLEVTAPGGPAGYTPTWTTPAKAAGKDDEYTFEWTGPWTGGSPGTGPCGNCSSLRYGSRA